MTEIMIDKDEDWEKRILCSDESCIGVIGADGKCKECGKVYDGVLPEGRRPELTASATADEMPPASPELTIADNDEDWEKRILCSDESCIGVVGADGKCKECGKPL